MNGMHVLRKIQHDFVRQTNLHYPVAKGKSEK